MIGVLQVQSQSAMTCNAGYTSVATSQGRGVVGARTGGRVDPGLRGGSGRGIPQKIRLAFLTSFSLSALSLGRDADSPREDLAAGCDDAVVAVETRCVLSIRPEPSQAHGPHGEGS